MSNSTSNPTATKIRTRAAGLLALLFLSPAILLAQKTFDVRSPNGAVNLTVQAGTELEWSVQDSGRPIIAPSAIALRLQGGEVLGDNAKIISSSMEKVDSSFVAIDYIKSTVPDRYNQLTLHCEGDYGVIFRVYDDAVAYRFFTDRKGEVFVTNEDANFNFTGDDQAFIPYMNDYRDGKIFNSSFEAL